MSEPVPKDFLKEEKKIYINIILKEKLSIHHLDSAILMFHYRPVVLLFMMFYTIMQSSWMEWNFTKIANASWENGCSEAMVKLVMTRTIGDVTLMFGEQQAAMFEVANI